jgi:hypothetical protein
MKSALRNQASTTLGTAAASVLLAAIALTVSGCSGAESADLYASPSDSTSEAQEAASQASAEPTTPQGDTSAEPAADVETKARTEQSQQSTRRSRGSNDAQPSSVVKSPSSTPSQPEPAAEATAEPATESTTAVHTNTMRVSGRQLLDSCGQPFVVRGVEQILGEQLPEGNDWLGLVREIASTGANAVRILPGVNTLTLENIDEVLTFIGQQGMVAFIDPLNGDDWYARADVKAMLKKHESYLIIDAYGEPQYDDIDKWRTEAKDALVRMRALGYEVPFTVYANQFGRALPALFDFGAEILAADPLHNTFLGWQAYWGNTGYYQEHYGYTLSEAVDAIVASGLPIQMGLDHITDLPSTEADFETLMAGAQANGVGWLWWDFYNPYGSENNLSEDGSADNLTATGSAVLASHPASIANTAQRTCGR